MRDIVRRRLRKWLNRHSGEALFGEAGDFGFHGFDLSYMDTPIAHRVLTLPITFLNLTYYDDDAQEVQEAIALAAKNDTLHLLVGIPEGCVDSLVKLYEKCDHRPAEEYKHFTHCDMTCVPESALTPIPEQPDNPAYDSTRVLYIYNGVLGCEARGHKLEAVTGTLATVKGSVVHMNVNYCHECRRHFVSRSEYEHYRSLHGPLLGNITFQSDNDGETESELSLNEESPLMLCGYGVSVREGLTIRERRLLLANIMDRGILSKPRVMEYLQFFISWRENNPKMAEACKKWRSDLDWVRDYRIDEQRRFDVESIRRFNWH